MQMARFKRIAKDFGLLVKSAALNLETASPGAVPWEPPSSQPGESDSESVKHHDPARHNPEPFSGAQRQRIMEALGALSSGLSLSPAKTRSLVGCSVQY
jgi:hypothetical protein